MATVTKTYCDCCGQEIVHDVAITPYSSKYYIRRIYRYNGNNSSLEAIDLCDTCKESIDTAIDAIFNPVVEEEINNET